MNLKINLEMYICYYRFLLDVLSSVNVLRRTVIESRMTTENRNIEELSRLDKTIERNAARG